MKNITYSNKKNTTFEEERLFNLGPCNIEKLCRNFGRLDKMLAEKYSSDEKQNDDEKAGTEKF